MKREQRCPNRLGEDVQLCALLAKQILHAASAAAAAAPTAFYLITSHSDSHCHWGPTAARSWLIPHTWMHKHTHTHTAHVDEKFNNAVEAARLLLAPLLLSVDLECR